MAVGCVAFSPVVVVTDVVVGFVDAVGTGDVDGTVVVVPFIDVTTGATPAVAVISGSAMENRLDEALLQQSSAEQQYLLEFLPHRITHSPPSTLSVYYHSQIQTLRLYFCLFRTLPRDSPATQFSGHAGDDQVLSVQVPRINCNSFPVEPSHHPAGIQREFEVQRNPAVQQTLASAVPLQGTSFEIVPSGV